MEGFCLCSSLAIFLAVILLDPQDYIPLPIYGTPISSTYVGRQLYQIPIIISAILGGIFLICTLVLFARRGKHIFYFQWFCFFFFLRINFLFLIVLHRRALVAVFFWVVMLVIFAFLFFLTRSPIFGSVVADYIDCVGSHPQISPPPCEKEIYRPFFIYVL